MEKMTKAQIIEKMEAAGMMFAKDATKAQLIALFNAQNTQSEEEMTMTEEMMTVANEAANEDVIENTEVIEIPAEQGAVTLIKKFAEVEAPVSGVWYEMEDGVIKQYEAPAEDVHTDEAPVIEAATEEIEVLDESSPEAPTDETKTDDVPPTETPATEETTNKRRIGKEVEWYEDGQLKDIFPSIKACATYLKETLGLKHMPFTPIMKSIRSDIDWDQYSFRFAGQEVIAATPVTDEKPADEVIEEVQEVTEELVEAAEEIIEEQTEEIENAEHTA